MITFTTHVIEPGKSKGLSQWTDHPGCVPVFDGTEVVIVDVKTGQRVASYPFDGQWTSIRVSKR